MDRNNHSWGISVNSVSTPARNQEGEKVPSQAVYKLKIKMTKSQIQIKFEKLVVWNHSFISPRQKYIGYSKRTISIYWHTQRETTSAQPYSILINTWSIKFWQTTLIINESKTVTFSDHWELESKGNNVYHLLYNLCWIYSRALVS